MSKLRLFLTSLAILVAASLANAQTKVTGVVIAEDDGLPVIGASVFVKGSTKNGTITDVDGKFTLNVPGSAKTLVVSNLLLEFVILLALIGGIVHLLAQVNHLLEIIHDIQEVVELVLLLANVRHHIQQNSIIV